MIGLSFARNRGLTLSGAPFAGDFIEFYNSGRILNTYGADRLYDFQLQEKLTQEFLPGFSVPFVTPPYVAILFSPLAHLPLWFAYLIWILISIALYLAAVSLVLRLELLPRRMTILISLAFPPFLMLTIAGGQISAIGCFIFASWLYLLKTERKFLAGAVLGLLLYKPTLSVFVVPALLFGRQVRVLMGFATVSILLGFVGIWMLGITGSIHYLAVLREFSSLVGSGFTRAAMHVDLTSFVRRLVHVDIKYFSILFGLLLTFLIRRTPERAMALTLVFNSYGPVYDLILLVPLLIVAYSTLSREMLVTLFVGSFLTVPICQLTGIQIITPILVFLCYVLCIKPMVQSGSGSFTLDAQENVPHDHGQLLTTYQ